MFRYLFLLGFLLQGPAAATYAMPPELEKIVSSVVKEDHGDPAYPIVLADLDETLIDSTLRRYYSMQESLHRICGEKRADECGKVSGLNLSEFFALTNRYDVNPLFDGVGLPAGEWRAGLLKQTVDTYLSGKYLDLDQAVPGAVEFIQALEKAGAEIYFVTARFEDVQRAGTIDSLNNLGFAPRPDRVFLRPRGMDSLPFKKKVFDAIRARLNSEPHAYVHLVMENEPENMNAMMDAFPTAQAVFVDGAFLKDEPVHSGAIHIKNFR